MSTLKLLWCTSHYAWYPCHVVSESLQACRWSVAFQCATPPSNEQHMYLYYYIRIIGSSICLMPVGLVDIVLCVISCMAMEDECCFIIALRLHAKLNHEINCIFLKWAYYDMYDIDLLFNLYFNSKMKFYEGILR